MPSPTAPPLPPAPPIRPSSRRPGAAVGVLVGLDAVSGAVAVVDGINPPRDAWGSRARLAAVTPHPAPIGRRIGPRPGPGTGR